MHEHLKVKLELVKELKEFLEKEKIKYYLEGDIIINIYKDIDLEKNVSLDIAVLSDLKNIDKLNKDNRYIRKVSDNHYRYVNTDTLFLNLLEKDKNADRGIYIDIYLNKKDYKDYKKIKLLDFEVSIPKDLDSYMLDNYGLGYKYLNEKEYVIPANTIFSPVVSYNEYIKYANGYDWDVENGDSICIKSEKRSKKERKYQAIADKMGPTVHRTHSRFKMLELYEDKKDEILKLAKKKDYKALGEILNDYLYEIKKQYDRGFGLCFDKDIFDVTIDYLKHDNQKELASWLLENTPKEHLKNIDFSYHNTCKTEEGQLRDLQKSFVKRLVEFDKLCKKHDIVYFLDSGSVLGAVRNGGFLPWDDDVDVILTYDNFDKLKKALSEEPIKNTQFVCIENTPNHTLYTGKIYDKTSSKVYHSYSLLDSTYGFHLDVIIYDEYIDNKYKRKINNYLFHIYGQLLNPNEMRYKTNNYIAVSIGKALIKIFGREKFLKFYRKIIFSNKDKSSKYYHLRWQKELKIEKEMYKEQLYVPFENVKLPIPIGYEKYLEKMYGESWFAIPNPEDRKPSKRVFNLYVPYNMYQDDYMSFLDKDLTNKAYRKLKMIKMRRVKLEEQAKYRRTILKYFRDKLELNKTMDLEHINKLFKNHKYAQIRDELKEYYDKQSKKTLLSRNMLIIEDKDFIYNLIYSYIMCGNFYTVRKFVKCSAVKEILGKETADSLLKLIENTKTISKKSDKDKKDLYKKYPYCLPFAVEAYPLLSKKEKEEMVKNLSKAYDNIGESNYVMALYELENKNKKKAIELLEIGKENTRNGLLVKKMNDLLKELK